MDDFFTRLAERVLGITDNLIHPRGGPRFAPSVEEGALSPAAAGAMPTGHPGGARASIPASARPAQWKDPRSTATGEQHAAETSRRAAPAESRAKPAERSVRAGRIEVIEHNPARRDHADVLPPPVSLARYLASRSRPSQ